VKLSKDTVEILKNFAQINNNLVIKTGKKISTLSPSKAIMAEYEGDDEFDEDVALFNLTEFLGAFSSFSDPELDLDTKSLTIKQGKQQVKYVYANEDVLITPKKAIVMPTADVTVKLTNETIVKMQKMASVLSVEDIAIVGDGKTVSIKVLDKKNPTANSFDIDLEVATKKNFTIYFKIDNLRLFSADYSVELSSKRISKWSADGIKLTVFIAVEADSTFA